MKHIVSLSGGVSSSVAADRVINRYGRENVTLWFADTKWEDEDLYRFLDDCMRRWGGEMVRYEDGRTPLEVFESQKIIGNSFLAPCTFRLKIEPFAKYLKEFSKPVTIHLGLNWDEQHRMESPRKNYSAIEGVAVDFPLMWEPYCWDTRQEVRSWGIEIPRLYKMGFSHNNCGGRCVKQGIGEWNRLRIQMPERFAEVSAWEQSRRATGGKLENRSIAARQVNGVKQPLTLEEIALENQPVDGEHAQGDMFACFCSY